ncbi:MAG: helix-turn-helix transcriptional regulator [Methyloceanibacter sp.]|nr:helix-turn-helix transcriptional regulator [Methyloceanibacter sp.]
MDLVFSTDELPLQDRFSYWVDVVCKQLLEIRGCADAGSQFAAKIHAARLAESTCSVFDVSDCELERDERLISNSACDHVIIALQLAGRQWVSGVDTNNMISAGDLFLVDTRVPYTHRVANSQTLCVKFPRSQLQARLGDTEDLSWHKAKHRESSAALAAHVMRGLPQLSGVINKDAATLIEGQLLDLVELAFSKNKRQSAAKRTYARLSALRRLKQAIEINLFDTRCSLTDFADKAGISLRYANILLKDDDTSLGRYVLSRRLERSRAALDDPTRTIMEIARSCGFRSAAHFSKTFRKKFGLSPSAYRHTQ